MSSSTLRIASALGVCVAFALWIAAVWVGPELSDKLTVTGFIVFAPSMLVGVITWMDL